MMASGAQVLAAVAGCVATLRAGAAHTRVLRERTRVLGAVVVACLSVAVAWHVLIEGGLTVGSWSSSALYAALSTAVLSLVLDKSSDVEEYSVAVTRYMFVPAVFAFAVVLGQLATRGATSSVVWSVWFVIELALFWSAFAISLWGAVTGAGWLSGQAGTQQAESALRILGSILGLLSLSLVAAALATFGQRGEWWVWSQAHTTMVVIVVALLAVLHGVRIRRASARTLAWVMLGAGAALLLAAVVWSGGGATLPAMTVTEAAIDGIRG